MTKLYTTLFLLFATVCSFAQTCTPDNSFIGSSPGIYPATPLQPNCDLIASKTIISLTDTLVSITSPIPLDITVYIDAMRVNEVQGLPAGITFETDVMGSVTVDAPYGIWFNPGSIPNQTSAIGCAFGFGTGGQWDALINGGPNSDGVYPIDFIVDARVGQTNPNVSALGLPNGSWLSENPGLTGGAFVISQTIVVLPGYDTLNAVIAGETNVAPSTPYAYSVGNDPNVTYNWSATNGTVTSGQGTNSVMIEWNGAPTGNVQVELTDGGCYGITDMDVTSTSIGIAGGDDVEFFVAPNPSTGIFSITSEQTIQSIAVTDLSGRVVLESRGQNTIDLTDQPNGLYLIAVQTTSGFGFTRIVKH